MKSMMKRTTLREIKQSLGRYLAIFAIVALGVAFFAGLKVTTIAMIETGNEYIKEHQMYDFKLMSTMGFAKEDDKAVREEIGDVVATGVVETDFIYQNSEGEENVLMAHSMTKELNGLHLVKGRLPQAADECVLDKNIEGVKIGDKIVVSENNDEDRKEMFSYDTYTVVGLADSPLYLNFERGSTSLLTGKISGFVYLHEDGFDTDYFTGIYLRYNHEYDIYSEKYKDFIDEKEKAVEAVCEERSNLRYEKILADATEELNDAQTELNDKKVEAEEELADAKAKLDDAQVEIEDAEAEIEKNEKTLNDSKKQLNDGLKQIADSKAMLQAMNVTVGPQWDALVTQEAQLNEQLKAVNSGLNKLSEGKEELQEHKQELLDGQKEYEEAKAEFDEEIADAQQKINDARAELDEIEEPTSYTLTRDENIGYVCYENDVNIVDGIAVVFPVFFFMVAALVCITTMNRMVEEQRTQIGVLKALGYSGRTIMSKYMFYSGSAALSGAVCGFLAGSYVFPLVIWQAYKLMYSFSDEIVFVLDGSLALISLIVALLCSIGATYFSCYYELSSVAAALIRPKAPKNGKRIFLEHIGFIWKNLKFLHKVSIRNVVRYKKRFFMMVLGISGCSALLVAGFGIKDSLKVIMPRQYDEIQVYDTHVTFQDELNEEEEAEFAKRVKELATDYLYMHEESVDGIANGVTRPLTLLAPKSSEEFSNFIHLRSLDGEAVAFPKEGEAVITHKAAERMSLSVGDKVMLRDLDGYDMELTISGIAENYVYSYVYICPESYESGMGKEITFENAMVNLINAENYDEANARISDLSFVAAASAIRTFEERFNNMIGSLDLIVILVVSCAAALAFIVLYNLTNINITERIREIATIKVLGFYAGETASYVFRENLVLTVIGGLVGLLLGKALHAFVMYKIDIDSVAFTVFVEPVSFLYSFLLTIVFALFVNLIMFFKLEKINMAESLKSIE